MTRLYLYKKPLSLEECILPEAIIKHSNSYKIKEKRLLSLSMYMKLSKKLEALGRDISELKFINGKPIIDGLYLSFSHTNSHYGFIIAANEIGLDIEDIIPIARLKLSDKILSASEREEFSLSEDKPLYLTNKWTIKEAYSKYLGSGLTDEIFNRELNGLNLKIDNEIIGIYGANSDISIYLDDILIKRI